MTRFLLAAAVAVALLFAGQARSAEPPIIVSSDAVCPDAAQSVGHAIHNALVHYPDMIMKRYTGADAQVGIAIYDQLPKPSNDKGDTLYAAFNPNAPDAWLIVTQGDCVVSNGLFPVAVVVEVMKAIEKAKGPAS